MVNGAVAPDLANLMAAGLGIICASMLIGLMAALMARGRRASVTDQMRAGYEAPFAASSSAQSRAGSPLEEAIAALVMDFVQSRKCSRPENESRAQRQNTAPGDSEFANRDFMN